jgi:glycolate oxidase FAD binding subunit
MQNLTSPPNEQLISLLGNEAVLPVEDLARYAVDGLEPDAVVRPIDRQGISQVLKWACSEGMSVVPRGGGTQLNLGNVPDRLDLVLDLSSYGSRSPDHRPADLTATVDSGITLEVLQRALARHGQFLPLEAPLAASATIGGVLAANTSGPMRYSYGLPRDWLIGIGVVSAQGVETNAGGQVVKNVSGYDLNKLYAGSLGTLGVIVEATFKLSPFPPESRALAATFPSLQPGMQAADSLLQQIFAPQGLQVIDGHAARQGATINANLRGMGTADDSRGAVVLAFFAGRNRAIRRRVDDATKLLRDHGALDIASLEGADAIGLLETLTDLGWIGESIPYLGLKLSLPPSAVVKLINQLTDPATDGQDPIDLAPLSLGVVADPGFGLVRLLWWAHGADDGGSPGDDRIAATISRVRDLSRRLGGSTVVEHCPLSVKKEIDVWGETTETIDIMRRIKEKFDPARILNPGRFVGGI